MKLRNKKTGEIVENAYIRESHDFYNKRVIAVFIQDRNHPPERVSRGYETLADLNAVWEDYEEPKDSFWTIGKDGTPIEYTFDFDGKFYEECDNEWIDKIKEMGFYFEAKEDAERAVEKFKAWTRLENNGFRVSHWYSLGEGCLNVSIRFDKYAGILEDDKKDLDLLFGGGE